MITQLTCERFLSKNGVGPEQWAACNLSWEDLLAIGVAYEKQVASLEAAAGLLANTIQRFEAVHSVRWRVKDVEHLLIKIIRKRSEGNKKYINISASNFNEIITDLIGIRALHLFKADFERINKSIVDSFVLKDKTVVYVREGDDPDFSQQCIEAGFVVEPHPKGYRSIHYIVTTQPFRHPIHVEVQVRTIFEEGWSEIDHIVRYPNYSDDVQLAYLLTIFNRMAGSADEMGGFVRILAGVLKDAKTQLEDAVREKEESFAKAESALEQLAAEKNTNTDNDRIKTAQQEIQKLKNGLSQPKSISVGLLQRLAEHGVTGISAEKLKDQLRAFDDKISAAGMVMTAKTLREMNQIGATAKAAHDQNVAAKSMNEMIMMGEAVNAAEQNSIAKTLREINQIGATAKAAHEQNVAEAAINRMKPPYA